MLMSPNYPQLTQAGGKEGMSHPPPLGKGREGAASHGVNSPRAGCCCTLKSDNRKVKRARSVYLRILKVASGLCPRPRPCRALAPGEVPTAAAARHNESPRPRPRPGQGEPPGTGGASDRSDLGVTAVTRSLLIKQIQSCNLQIER